MVTSQPPFNYKKIDEVLHDNLEEELTPPDHLNTKLSAGLGEIVEFMMAKKRNKRYPSPDELITDLECLLHGDPPKFARQKLDAARLQELAEGAAEEDEEESEESGTRGRSRKKGVPQWWLTALGAGLGVS